MVFIIDLVVIAIVAFAIFRGIKKGFVNSSFDVFGIIIIIAIAVCGTATLMLVCTKCGLVNKLADLIKLSFAENNPVFEKLGLTNEKISKILSLFIVVGGCFVLSFFPSRRAYKSLKNTLCGCIKKVTIIRIFDSAVGAVVNLVFVCAFLFGAFRILKTFENVKMFSEVDEVICSCPISGKIYENNPLNAIFNTDKIS